MQDLLFFECDANRYAVAADDVESIVWLPQLSPVDGVPRWLAGHLNWHGGAVPVIDLGALLGHASRPRHLSDQLIMLNDAQHQLAILVSRVDQLEALEEGLIVVRADDHAAGGQLPFRAEIREGDRLVMLLDVAALARRLEELPTVGLAEALPEVPADAQGDDAAVRIFLERMHRLAEVRMADAAGVRTGYALVHVEERQYAIALSQVAEFAHLHQMTRLPGVPPYLAGCMNLRGEVLGVLDLSQLLGLPHAVKGQQVVVLTDSGKRLALRISGVERMIDVDSQSIQAIGDTDEQHPLAKQLLHLPDVLVAVLDVETLFKGGVLDVSEPF